MNFQSKRREASLEYRTDKFLLGFEVGGERNPAYDTDPSSGPYLLEHREALTQLEMQLKLTERASVPNEPFEIKRWCSVSVNYFNHLNPDGTFERLRAHGESLDSSTIPIDKKNLEPALETLVKDAFPNHNVVLRIDIHSALEKSVQPGDHFDKREVVRPAVMEAASYLVERGQEELDKISMTAVRRSRLIENNRPILEDADRIRDYYKVHALAGKFLEEIEEYRRAYPAGTQLISSEQLTEFETRARQQMKNCFMDTEGKSALYFPVESIKSQYRQEPVGDLSELEGSAFEAAYNAHAYQFIVQQRRSGHLCMHIYSEWEAKEGISVDATKEAVRKIYYGLSGQAIGEQQQRFIDLYRGQCGKDAERFIASLDESLIDDPTKGVPLEVVLNKVSFWDSRCRPRLNE